MRPFFCGESSKQMFLEYSENLLDVPPNILSIYPMTPPPRAITKHEEAMWVYRTMDVSILPSIRTHKCCLGPWSRSSGALFKTGMSTSLLSTAAQRANTSLGDTGQQKLNSLHRDRSRPWCQTVGLPQGEAILGRKSNLCLGTNCRSLRSPGGYS